MSIHDSLLGRTFVDNATRALLGDARRLDAMLAFEAALARAQSRCGLVPTSALAPIAAACDARHYDVAALGDAARLAGNLAIPLIKALTAEVKAHDADAARWVHWGATSQDVIDTGLVLQLRDVFDHVDAALARMIETLAALTRTHRRSVMAGRTWLQQAVPTTFGLKTAGWLDALLRHRARLHELRPRVLVLQFGGAAGTLASLGEHADAVSRALAAELQLGAAALPWHTQRDRIVEVGAWFGLLAGTLGKIARDLSLMMQTEVAEVFEPAGAGRGGSSAMPHKRNPVGCAVALAAAIRTPHLVATLYSAMAQEHERGLGNWPAEWETLPELIGLTGGSLAAMQDVLAGLDVDTARMRRNLDATHGLLFAERASMKLAEALGKSTAHHLVEQASKRVLAEQRPLRAVLGDDPQVAALLDDAALAALFDPLTTLGDNDAFIDRVLADVPASGHS
ncbi:3-carboxy-cis,cis-muconate cycloisomerase [Solimonas marina]|uniref:3-carboxy-cis,cis-muconate cycloisomerase n=1 Tax=Solimonas marina TaxID=2714601 RepID=A0A970B7C6_9GAMM|nr:3-carboxy-cis,cis-muconate cycloisomerase [Solimonas marina]NKF23753.1 3-carboxy-cis,cis-muconate cycloisomerase [Solimonas marina]